ncbi:MerR family transcriptional regulator [Acidiferrimicrobium sp. IK]|uniref:MerR family transcriptional regulator n=1 Tax=Acidiferrimicrobium sp. IK TaxID=2871700 RepID=UPI0021CAF797|nr:MerR family transcriptional regulator [Acidiferrimicrobium sp. IK]MCU4185116.1 MerR family transcriptional regulator [Acidiferrimicrobium sp. IK]
MSAFGLDDHDAPLYTVGQVASLLGVAPSYLRRLDEERVVEPARTDGGQRRYSRNEIHRAERVVELAGEGVTLAGIVRIMALEVEVARLRKEVASLQTAMDGDPGTGRGAPRDASPPTGA